MTVYIVRQGAHGPVKIGWTERQMEERLSALQTANHDALCVIRVVDGGRYLEKWFHRRFADQRLDPRREWFSFHPDMLTAMPEPSQPPEPRCEETSEENAEFAAAFDELTELFSRIEAA